MSFVERTTPSDFISWQDVSMLHAGIHPRIYDVLGARLLKPDQGEGVHFAVWAPHAKRVSVVGDFNQWNPDEHILQPLGESGVWSATVEKAKCGDAYKFAIDGNCGFKLKADPYAYASELRPSSASKVTMLEGFEWTDSEWLTLRSNVDWKSAPISIYEVHLGSWKKTGPGEDDLLTYRELAHQLVDYVIELGYTHIELMPVAEHPLDMSWGYQVIGYYAPTARFGDPQDFMYFVNHCHANGIGVLLDWVPAHFPKDDHGLSMFDGEQIYAYRDPRKGEHKGWGTMVFDYGRNEVRNFLIGNARFWLDRYHIDGLRVDAVSSMLYLNYCRSEGEWIPNAQGGEANLEAIELLRDLNLQVHRDFPGVLMIAEESTAWPRVCTSLEYDGLGFDMKWNMGWMHDTLRYFVQDPINRRNYIGDLTFSACYAFSENFVLAISHDEVVYGKCSLLSKMPGDDWQKFANLRLFLGMMFGHPGKKLLFMGSEFAQRNEWYYAQSLDWHLLQHEPHRQMQLLTRALNDLYREQPCLYTTDFDGRGFEWIDFSDLDNGVVSFLRKTIPGDQHLLFVANTTPVPRCDYRVGVPWNTPYRELLNTDETRFGGQGYTNAQLSLPSGPWQNRPHSICINLAPLGVSVLQPVPQV